MYIRVIVGDNEVNLKGLEIGPVGGATGDELQAFARSVARDLRLEFTETPEGFNTTELDRFGKLCIEEVLDIFVEVIRSFLEVRDSKRPPRPDYRLIPLDESVGELQLKEE